MPQTAIQAYWERLPERQNELRLLLAEVVSLPHTEARDRRAALRRWRKGVPSVAQPGKPDDLRRLGINVKVV